MNSNKPLVACGSCAILSSSENEHLHLHSVASMNTVSFTQLRSAMYIRSLNGNMWRQLFPRIGGFWGKIIDGSIPVNAFFFFFWGGGWLLLFFVGMGWDQLTHSNSTL